MTPHAVSVHQFQAPRRAPQFQGFGMMETGKFRIRTMDDAHALSRFAAEMFPDPGRVQPGLYQILMNAVEHGCLEIGHALKTQLVDAGTWREEVLRRESLPENRKKTVETVLARREEGIFAVITDPGPGFDWKSWLSIDPARAGHSAGRGIASARGMSFDSVTYNAKGNQAILRVKDGGDIAW